MEDSLSRRLFNAAWFSFSSWMVIVSHADICKNLFVWPFSVMERMWVLGSYEPGNVVSHIFSIYLNILFNFPHQFFCCRVASYHKDFHTNVMAPRIFYWINIRICNLYINTETLLKKQLHAVFFINTCMWRRTKIMFLTKTTSGSDWQWWSNGVDCFHQHPQSLHIPVPHPGLIFHSVTLGSFDLLFNDCVILCRGLFLLFLHRGFLSCILSFQMIDVNKKMWQVAEIIECNLGHLTWPLGQMIQLLVV